MMERRRLFEMLEQRSLRGPGEFRQTQSLGHLLRWRNVLASASTRFDYEPSAEFKQRFGQVLANLKIMAEAHLTQSREIGGIIGTITEAVATNILNWVKTVSATKYVILPTEKLEMEEVRRKLPLSMSLGYLDTLKEEK